MGIAKSRKRERELGDLAAAEPNANMNPDTTRSKSARILTAQRVLGAQAGQFQRTTGVASEGHQEKHRRPDGEWYSRLKRFLSV